MKVCFYTGDMNLNRKDEKKYAEIQKIDFLGNKTVKTFFFWSKCLLLYGLLSQYNVLNLR